jgi:hypothetical protein
VSYQRERTAGIRPLTRRQAKRLRAAAHEEATVTVHWQHGDSHRLVDGELVPPNPAIQAQLDDHEAVPA